MALGDKKLGGKGVMSIYVQPLINTATAELQPRINADKGRFAQIVQKQINTDAATADER